MAQILVLSFIFVCGSMVSLLFAEIDVDSVSMNVHLEKPQKRMYFLKVTLANQGDNPISIYPSDLPWSAHEQTLWNEAVRLDNNQSPLLSGGPVINYSAEKLVIRPGKKLSGSVYLNGRFPTLLEDIQNLGVKVNWHCYAKNITVVCPQGKKGYFIIPKGDPHGRE